MKKLLSTIGFVLLSITILLAQDNWELQTSRITSKWAKTVKPGSVLPEYPRPHLVRSEWLNLNGLWDYAIAGSDTEKPAGFDGKILVPFAVESALSGLKLRLSPRQSLWYRCNFEIPENWNSKNILINFGAVYWEATVYVNGV